MNVETPTDLFVTEVQRAYGIETELADELSKLAEDIDVDALDNVHDDAIRESLGELIRDHAAETADHADRLETVFEALDRQPETRSTPALDGLIEEKERFNNVVLSDELRPLYYLGTSEQIERLEISLYERLLRLGQHLDVSADAIDVLERNLEEEMEALDALQSLAESEDAASLTDAVVDATDYE